MTAALVTAPTPVARPRPLTVRQPGKRALDVALASVLLVVTLPLLALAALAVVLADGGPALYRQRRVGRGGRRFEILKLRTMVVGADTMVDALTAADRNARDGHLFKVHGDPRITRVGRVLRRFCIDELPQLWNVVRGDMSLVGPRPLPVDPEAFDARDRARHAVRPGVTGPWQVEGTEAYRTMIDLDLAYVRRWSLWLDAVLLVRTVPAVLLRRSGTC